MRCAFWREQAGMLAARNAGECVFLYQVLVEKKKEGSGELGSWRMTQVLDCPLEKEEEIKAALRKTEECKMLTEIPTRDWAQCEAVPSTLSALVGAIVPGQLRQMDTVFKVWGLQVMGVSSVRSETDEWVLKSCGKCKKAAPCQARLDKTSTHPTYKLFPFCLPGSSKCCLGAAHGCAGRFC